jgi:hypothetical protein
VTKESEEDGLPPEGADATASGPTAKDASSMDALFVDWVLEHFALVEYVGTEKRAPWCPEWWKHPEAVERLWVLWLARTQAYANDDDLSAASSWWAYHWDHHAPILLDARLGPFRHCDRTLGHLHEQDANNTVVVEVERPPSNWRRHQCEQ